MKKTMQKTGTVIFNFGIPAFRSDTGLITCPNAKNCVAGCYARSGTYRFSVAVKAYEKRLAVTLSDNFVQVMSSAIQLKKIEAGKKSLFIRIHDSGDFYNEVYLKKWIDIINNNPSVQFYAYTKQVAMFKKFKALGLIPDNFTTIFSLGGKQDHLIDVNTDRHAKVYSSSRKLDKGYINATNNDLFAISKTTHKVGLVYHGVKKYNNTNWSKVVAA